MDTQGILQIDLDLQWRQGNNQPPLPSISLSFVFRTHIRQRFFPTASFTAAARPLISLTRPQEQHLNKHYLWCFKAKTHIGIHDNGLVCRQKIPIHGSCMPLGLEEPRMTFRCCCSFRKLVWIYLEGIDLPCAPTGTFGFELGLLYYMLPLLKHASSCLCD
jgi:hypothetical protein